MRRERSSSITVLEAMLIVVEPIGMKPSTDRNAGLVDKHLVEDGLSSGRLEHHEAAEAVAERPPPQPVSAVTAARSAHSSSRL